MFLKLKCNSNILSCNKKFLFLFLKVIGYFNGVMNPPRAFWKIFVRVKLKGGISTTVIVKIEHKVEKI